MVIYSYVITRDYGFAPNPFFGWCTLATCKPVVRRCAQVGDWVIGTGSSARGTADRLIYAMRVEEAMTFDEYWNDERFARKKPRLDGSLKLAFGDNIYSTKRGGGWRQLPSHHSLHNGRANPLNVEVDTKTDRVLVSSRFVYYGASAIKIPRRLLDCGGESIAGGRGHRCNFGARLQSRATNWLESLDLVGLDGEPDRWVREIDRFWE